uniref:Uncharacterized protein n=1 Tax=Daphnia magna TaxID=35525 RepID=A0A0N8D4K3_9CRUS
MHIFRRLLGIKWNITSSYNLVLFQGFTLGAAGRCNLPPEKSSVFPSTGCFSQNFMGYN